MFRIIVDAKHRVVKVETSGIGTAQSVADFDRRHQATLEANNWKSGEFSLLMHALDTLPQPQEVVQAIELFLMHAPRQPRRIAIVKNGAIAALQTRRLSTGRNIRNFTTTAEAEEWLNEVPDKQGRSVEVGMPIENVGS